MTQPAVPLSSLAVLQIGLIAIQAQVQAQVAVPVALVPAQAAVPVALVQVAIQAVIHTP